MGGNLQFIQFLLRFPRVHLLFKISYKKDQILKKITDL